MIYKDEISRQAITVLSIEQPDEVKSAIKRACQALTPDTRDSANILPAHILSTVYNDLSKAMAIGCVDVKAPCLTSDMKKALKDINRNHIPQDLKLRFDRLDYFFGKLHTAYALKICRNMKEKGHASDLEKEIRRKHILDHLDGAGIEVEGTRLGRVIDKITPPSVRPQILTRA